MRGRATSPVLYLEEDRGYETPCHIWQRSTCDGGKYGHLRREGRMWLTHRWFWTQKFGPIPEGKQLHHKCEVTLCCNPDHVEPVTGTENTRLGARTKLTREKVNEILARLAAGEKQYALALEYGVDTLHIWRIKRGLTWADA